MNTSTEMLNDYIKENMVNEFLHKIIAISHPNDAINEMLKFLAEKFSCERAYIFELNNDETFSNTYELCAEGVEPQMQMLQNEPLEFIDWWWKLFEEDRPVIIEDLEDIRYTSPRVYAGLKPQNIVSLVAVAVHIQDELVGFIGVDNPSKDKIDSISNFLFFIGHILSFLLERRNLFAQMEFLSYHDQLTKAYSRYAYGKFSKELKFKKSLSVIFADISELKKINNTLGHEEGDKLIIFWYGVLSEVFPGAKIFRIDGDEFVVVCTDWSEAEFTLANKKLKNYVLSSEHHMAFGSARSEDKKANLLTLVNLAEGEMREEKLAFYDQSSIMGQNRNRRRIKCLEYEPPIEIDSFTELSAFNRFIKDNYFDLESFVKSISLEDSFPYFGDLETNMFYVPDTMRDLFGFKDNIVVDLLSSWVKRISNQDSVAMYKQEIGRIMESKRNVHDLKYKVKDAKGNDIWIRCHGLVKWNDDYSKPLFFSGAITIEEQNQIVDPITGFQREHSAVAHLVSLQKQKHPITIIGFTLNNFSQINELKGRKDANILLSNIAQRINNYFFEKLKFYRLDGLRFIGILQPGSTDEVTDLIQQLKEVIENMYYTHNVVVKTPCSIGILSKVDELISPHELILNMMALLSDAKKNLEEQYIIHSLEEINSQRLHAKYFMEISKNVLSDFKNFRVVIQPTVSLEDFKIHSGELLMRWNFEGKDVSPEIFIPMLENNRLILRAGKWVFEQAAKLYKRILSFIPDFKLGVNVSYYQVMDPEFLPFVEQVLKKYNLDGSGFLFEITETHYDETPTKVQEFIANCNALNIQIAIDDFGNGYSSLAFLLKYNANVVKLDRSLINEMLISDNNVNFISSIIYSCHKFGKKVCAEGVENKQEVDVLKEAECDMIQGYYFYKPMEIQSFYELIAQNELASDKE